MSACLRCPSDVPDSARFCPGCGSAVAPEPEDVTRSRPTPRSASPASPASARAASTPSPHPTSGIDHGRFLPGAVLGGRYRMVALLGRGGMGEVYRADDLRLGQPVALKFLPPRFLEEPERLKRLEDEVRNARQVAHPNVCRVFDVDQRDGEHFIIMEFVPGEDLATLLRRIGRLPADKALQIARQLCAGLAAAHARGVLHRDLKPSNVMLDDRGTVRIMDFGLAGGLAEFAGAAVLEGTPAYMAPEQLAGRAVGPASDIYALGLVLYELFTGRPAYGSGTAAEMLRQRESESPELPTRLVEGIDDATERAIMRCLEKEPAQRPSSVAAVAAALPGGDPLAAAIAAGETPSPDMVAAAGGEGALRPAQAWAITLGTALLVLLVVLLSPYSTDLGVAPLPRSADALADRARDLLRTLGYGEAAGDEASWFDRGYDYLLWEADQPRLRQVESWPGSATFVYRRSPRVLAPFANNVVTRDDPPHTFSGMAMVQLAPGGELMNLVVVPPEKEPGRSWPDPPWSTVLDLSGFAGKPTAESEPEWTPPVATDARRAWQATPWPGRPPVRIEAAAWHGRIVSVNVIGPWTKPTRTPAAAEGHGKGLKAVVRNVTPNLLLAVLICTTLVLARRNLHLGRGDRRGAMRVALFVAGTAILSWALAAHHVADVGAEYRLFLVNSAFSAFGASFVWLCYLALEPYVRRRWPVILIGWSRLLAGRFRDPLVGRDVLVGALAGAALGLVNHVINALPSFLHIPGQTPIYLDRNVLGSAAQLLGLLSAVVSLSVISGLAVLGVLFVVRLVVDNGAAAVAVTALVLSLTNLGGENFRIEFIVAIVSGVGPALVLTRYGLLALVAMTVVNQMMFRYPFTLELNRWYAGGTVFALVVLAAVVAFAFRVALGGRPAFATAHLPD